MEEREAQLKQQEDQLNQGGIPPTSTDEYTPPPSGNRNTGARNIPGDYPEASTVLLQPNELRMTSKEVLLLMRNEIFARHGYIFKRDDLYNHFITKPWYNPRLKDVSHLLSPIEKANIKLIKQFEDLWLSLYSTIEFYSPIQLSNEIIFLVHSIDICFLCYHTGASS